MTQTKSTVLSEAPISADARASIKRLLASDTILRAPRLRAVLEFIVDALFNGRGDEINEQSIGQAVFGRPAGYNQGDDNIVRVSVRHLRTRLDEYYRTEGKEETYRLEIPKGKYIPLLAPRPDGFYESVLQQGVTASESILLPDVMAKAQDMPKGRASGSKFGAAWILTAAFLLSTVIFGFIVFRNSRYNRSVANGATITQRGILQLLLQKGNAISVVVVDSNLQAYREIFKKEVTLDSYINRSYTQLETNFANPLSSGVRRYITETADTSVTSAIVATQIQRAALPAIVSIEYPHDLSVRDFQHKDFILLGGPWINPWEQLFEEQLNFRIFPLSDDPAASEIHNVNPKSGEPKIFAPHQQNGERINYARIAVLPNLSGAGRVILVGATSGDALEAGSDFLCAPNSLQDLLRRFKCSSAAQLPSFEVVLEVKGLETVPFSTRIVALRAIGPPA